MSDWWLHSQSKDGAVGVPLSVHATKQEALAAAAGLGEVGRSPTRLAGPSGEVLTQHEIEMLVQSALSRTAAAEGPAVHPPCARPVDRLEP
jgi:hypothetical protein